MNSEGLSVGGLSISAVPKRQIQKLQSSNVPTLPPIAKMKEMKATCTPSSSSSKAQRGSTSGMRNDVLVLNRRVGAPQPQHQPQQQQLGEDERTAVEAVESKVQVLDEPALVESVMEFRSTMTGGEKNSSPLTHKHDDRVNNQSNPIDHNSGNSSSSGGSGDGSGKEECPGKTPKTPQPKSMTRAKQWSPEVENLFRLQEAGYRYFIFYLLSILAIICCHRFWIYKQRYKGVLGSRTSHARSVAE